MTDPTYDRAVEVLLRRATVKQLNVLRAVYRYIDDKIVMEGLVPLDPRAKKPFDRIYIAIKQPPDSDLPEKAFSIPKSEDGDLTLVYFWASEPRRQFHREGRWEGYLYDLVAQIKAQIEATNRLNGTPVEDYRLFSVTD